jgi:hypothetical protein
MASQQEQSLTMLLEIHMVELEVNPFVDIMESRKEKDIPMDFIRSGIYIIERRPGSTI